LVDIFVNYQLAKFNHNQRRPFLDIGITSEGIAKRKILPAIS